jgi:hypothetical protein
MEGSVSTMDGTTVDGMVGVMGETVNILISVIVGIAVLIASDTPVSTCTSVSWGTTVAVATSCGIRGDLSHATSIAIENKIPSISSNGL